MRLTVAEARGLAERVMAALGHEAEDARTIADHLIDCELRGIHYGGLPRALSIAERIGRSGKSRDPVRVLHETPFSARLDGGDQLGYLVAHQATRLAIAKARAVGIAVVGAANTWYTGMLSYYAEMAAAEGLVSIIASHTAPWVAPHGASEGRFGTNPICFGFPSAESPIIWDVGTAAIIHAQATLARRLGERLPEGAAFDEAGRPTRDPAAALAGAFAAWGGHKGSGLGLVVQLLGGLAGAPFVPPDLSQFGFFMLALRPDLLGPADAFKTGAAAYAAYVRAARPVEGGPGVRMPFDRSREERRERIRRDAIDIEEDLHTALVAVAERR
jgi:delta1-piperideine-2-carboxylate reductase